MNDTVLADDDIPSKNCDTVPEVEASNIAVVARNELVGRGVESVLRSLCGVREIVRCAEVESIAAAITGATPADTVVVAARDIGLLDTLWPTLIGRGTAVLVLVDRAALQDPCGYTTLPVHGFLSHEHLSTETVTDALRRSRRGEMPIPPDLARVLLARADPQQLGRYRGGAQSLTSREREALTLLVRGLSNKQIARELAISSHGAKRLVASVMVKLGTPNRTAAAVVAVQEGLVADPRQEGA